MNWITTGGKLESTMSIPTAQTTLTEISRSERIPHAGSYWLFVKLWFSVIFNLKLLQYGSE